MNFPKKNTRFGFSFSVIKYKCILLGTHLRIRFLGLELSILDRCGIGRLDFQVGCLMGRENKDRARATQKFLKGLSVIKALHLLPSALDNLTSIVLIQA